MIRVLSVLLAVCLAYPPNGFAEEHPAITKLGREVLSLFEREVKSGEDYAKKEKEVRAWFDVSLENKTLTPEVMFDICRNSASATILALLDEHKDKRRLINLYEECAIKTLALDASGTDVREKLVWHLVKLTRSIQNPRLFGLLVESPSSVEDMGFQALLAQGFVDSRRDAINKLAISWSVQFRDNFLQNDGVGGAVVSSPLNDLLGLCGTPNAYAEILENAKKIPFQGDLLNAIAILAKVKYEQSLDFLKQLVLDEDGDQIVRIHALIAVYSITPHENTKFLKSKAAEFLDNRNGFGDLLDNEALEQIKRLMIDISKL
jgi:hypothetical protein